MSISKWRRTLRVAAAVPAAVITLAVAASPAGAGGLSTQDTCSRGEVCVYDDQKGLIASSYGNLWGTYGPMPAGGTIRNNGYADPGADHIEYTVVRRDGSTYDVCLHYPGDDTPTSGSVPIKGSARDIHWIDAC